MSDLTHSRLLHDNSPTTSNVIFGLSLLAAVGSIVFIDWTICTNFFGFGSEIEHRILLLVFAGWASWALAASDRSWVLLLFSFAVILIVLQKLLTDQEPLFFGVAIIALVGTVIFELMTATEYEHSILVIIFYSNSF